MIVSGPSQSGKTTFVRSLIHYKDVIFDQPPKKIVYCYGREWQSRLSLTTYRNSTDSIFIQELPKQYVSDLFPPSQRPGLIILDYFMKDVKHSERVCNLFTKGTYHSDVCALYITKNLFSGGKHSCTMFINTHYNLIWQMFSRDGWKTIYGYRKATT